MKRLVAAAVLFTLSCSAHAGQTLALKDLASQNNQRFQQLKQGMSRADVLRLMKDDVAEIPGGTVGNPYKIKSFEQGSAKYEVLYYVTQEATQQNNAMTTPVVLKEGVVAGLGLDALRVLKQ